MGFEFNRPKLKDSLYGEMSWEDDLEDTYWFSRKADDANGSYEILIYAETPTDFMAVRATHSTYRKIMESLAEIKKKSVRFLLENEEDVRFIKARHRDFAVKKIESEINLFCIRIYQDLSSEVIFNSQMFYDTDEFIFTLLEKSGEFIESSIDTF